MRRMESDNCFVCGSLNPIGPVSYTHLSGLSPIFLPRAKDQSVRGKAIPVNDITRKAVPQFLMSRGSVNVSLSTKIADVAIIREIQIATTEDIIIPK